MYDAEFCCPKCNHEWGCDWTFGDEVTCPKCGRVWETDCDTDYEDGIAGPWLLAEVKT